ncbi:HD domain-containing protein [Lachnospiraceae bacterium NE2001]|nr:HD domain-containing protein [Lachnospiraceae bacterium NE2001]
MKVITKKNIIYVLSMIALGVVINRVINGISGYFGWPLYLDSIGTMFIAALGGTFPGMMVGFITNMIGGLSDTSTFYYGTINVLIALIAGMASERGYFERLPKIVSLLPCYILLSIPCSLLTYILFKFQIGDNVSAPAVSFLHDKGLPILASQILGDFAVEIPDKLISLIASYFLYRLIPLDVRNKLGKLSGKEIKRMLSDEDKDKRSSLRIQLGIWLMIAGMLIVMVAFFISYKTYMEAKVAGYPNGTYDPAVLRTETLLYCGKMLSAVLGLLLCVVSFAMVLADHVVVTPLHKMARELNRFAYDSETGRDKSVAKIQSLDIKTGNEIQDLYEAMSKTVVDIDDYIDMTNQQASTINNLHINIITTLADIVESRDSTTGFHVKRTAKYCEIIAKELLRSGKYTDELTEEYIETLRIAAPLHDIGKIRIPDAILNKPGKLTDEEFDIIRTHTTMGKSMLESTKATMGETAYLEMAEDIAYCHHEWWDGSRAGYPQGISGTNIPLSARIMAVADVFDALVSRRPYKEPFSIEKALDIIVKEAGTHFDPEVVEAMLRVKTKICLVVEKYSE